MTVVEWDDNITLAPRKRATRKILIKQNKENKKCEKKLIVKDQRSSEEMSLNSHFKQLIKFKFKDRATALNL